MICGIHHFITNLKTKIDVIPKNRFKVEYVWQGRLVTHFSKKKGFKEEIMSNIIHFIPLSQKSVLTIYWKSMKNR